MAIPWIRWLSRIAVAIAVVVAALALPWAIWWLWLRLAPQWDRRTVIAIAIAALVPLGAIWWLWWQLPKRQAAHTRMDDPKARADAEDNFRKTVGQVLGGAAVLIGAGVAYLQFTQQQQASRDLLISNQVAKGFEQLAGDKLAMRLGGIYALEGVMKTSPEYHQPVLEALCAFVREGTTTRQQMTLTALLEALLARNGTAGKQVSDKPATDIRAALTVIGRRAIGPGIVDLSGANLTLANLTFANLRDANLRDANLTFANLRDADLTADLYNAILNNAILSGASLRDAILGDAKLIGAHLNGANLRGANLNNAILSGADLTNAILRGAILRGAILRGASLTSADLTDANLTFANLSSDFVEILSGADLNNANLNNAILTDADLTDADLTDAKNLTQAQLDQACGGKPRTLPPGLIWDKAKPCPEKSIAQPATP